MMHFCLFLLLLSLSKITFSKNINNAEDHPVVPTLPLGNGVEMPIVGYGTFQAQASELEQALEAALEVGYRHIDTAAFYENEDVIGRVLKRWFDSGKLKREDVFITTKLPPSGNRASSLEKWLKRQLKALQLDYVDLYLIHLPYAFKDIDFQLRPKASDGQLDVDNTNDHISTWKAMEQQVDSGLVRAIGVSNFNKTQLKRLLDNSRIKPANLQIELHAYFQQNELVNFCKKNNVTVTAYSPIGSSGYAKSVDKAGSHKEFINLLSNPVVQKIADKHHKTAAQVLLRFTTQRGIAVIPKSTNKERLRQNIDIFDFTLDEDDLKELKSLDAHLRLFTFTKHIPIVNHPEYPFREELKN